MRQSDIARLRLRNQGVTAPFRGTPADVVGWLVAVQAQDYAGAKWALGLRLNGATDGDIERAFAEGAILRTHLMRPTWHFVTPLDIRWLLALTAPRVHAANATMYRRLELDDAVLRRADAALADALQGGRECTRDELRVVLQEAGIATDTELRMSYLMMHAELEGVVCSGPRRGKQFTYALLRERAPQARTLVREEALAELAHRYFRSRGPSTVQDLAKWSGLTVADARSGLDAVRTELEQAAVDGQVYWFSAHRPAAAAVSPGACLLSIYDEYVSGYKDRRARVDEGDAARLVALGNALTNIIVVDGQIVGTWRRTLRRGEVIVELNRFTRLTEAEERAVAVAADRYGAFLGLAVVLA